MVKKCSVENCNSERNAKGLCGKHYMRLMRHGSPDKGNSRYSSPKKAFNSRIETRGNCIVWTGSKDSDGYGRMRIGDHLVSAHRFAWEQYYGPIPENMVIDHICHNPDCVKKEHLRLATQAQNLYNRSGATKRNKSSGARNVYKHGSAWRVRVYKDHKAHNFGTFQTLDEAISAAEHARQKLFGQFSGKG